MAGNVSISSQMQLMLRDREFPELAEQLRGKKVFVWTCNTCARLCDVGGSANAQRLAASLRSEGVEVTGVGSAKAACVMSSVIDATCSASQSCDVVLALTCDVGSRVAGEAFRRPCLNPIVTLGTGFLDASRTPVLKGEPEKPLQALSDENSLPAGPFL